MHFTMTRPCHDCPFLRVGGIRLCPERIEEIAGMLLSPDGGTFQCHQTVAWSADNDGENVVMRTERDQHCAGALIFALSNDNETQMMRIARRLRIFDPDALLANHQTMDLVFASLEEMLATAI